jgi:integrase
MADVITTYEIYRFEKNWCRKEKLKPIVIIALYYGLRRSEVLGLKWDLINFEKNIIEIKHTVLRYGSNFEERDRTKNSSSRRTLGLIPEIKSLLINLKREQEKTKSCLAIYTKIQTMFLLEQMGN